MPRSGLWKVVIYEGERFVRTDKENAIISVAEKRAEELNYQFGHRKEKRSWEMSGRVEQAIVRNLIASAPIELKATDSRRQ